MKTILVAIDTSRSAIPVVSAAAALAHATNARVVLVTVVQPPVIASEYTPMIENLAEIAAAGEKAAARHLASLKKRLEDGGIRTTSVHATGGPIAFILEQAKKCAADYIVMGSHGHTAFYDLLVGSTTHGVLRRARCPVVIVPPKKEPLRKRKR